MATVADALKQAREILLDTDANSGYRYSEADLLTYLWEAVQLAATLRPDIFIAQYTVPLPDSYVPTDPFPLPAKLFASTTTYIAGRCELRDSEFSLDGRAMTFIGALTTALVKGT